MSEQPIDTDPWASMQRLYTALPDPPGAEVAVPRFAVDEMFAAMFRSQRVRSRWRVAAALWARLK